MALTLAHNRMVAGAPVNVLDFGAVGDGVTDDTAAIQAAADYCVANGVSLYASADNTFLLSNQIDLRSIKGIDFRGTIYHSVDTFIPVLLGHDSTQTFEYNIYLHKIVWTNQPGSGSTKSNLPTNPQIRIVGFKNANVHIGDVEYIQLYADSDDPTTQSLAYNTFQIQQTNLLEFDTNPSPAGSTIQWINENKFLPGRIRRITMDGTYAHNNNIFYSQGMETNGEITLTKGFCNTFYDFRFEGSNINITFGSGHNNYITQSYSEVNYSAVGNVTPTVTQGAGAGNIVIRSYEQFVDKVSIFELSYGHDANAMNAGLNPSNIVKSGNGWDAQSTFSELFSSDLIPCVAGTGFTFSSDQAMWRPKIEFYNSSGVKITSATDPNLLNATAVTWSNVSNSYTVSTDIDEIVAAFVIANTGYFKITLNTGSTLPVFNYVNILGYAPKGHNNSALLSAISPKYLSAVIGVTAAEIADAANSINTTNKYPGKQVWVSDAYKTVYAATSLATGTWRFSDGTTAYTPS